MLELLANWLVNAIVIIVAAYLLPGVHVASFTAALWAALVLGVINAILKPILVLLTLPINLLTLGLFTFVINALLVLLATHLVSGFHVDSFWWALLFSLIVSVIHSVLNMFEKK
jgi:putative membrane protein